MPEWVKAFILSVLIISAIAGIACVSKLLAPTLVHAQTFSLTPPPGQECPADRPIRRMAQPFTMTCPLVAGITRLVCPPSGACEYVYTPAPCAAPAPVPICLTEQENAEAEGRK